MSIIPFGLECNSDDICKLLYTSMSFNNCVLQIQALVIKYNTNNILHYLNNFSIKNYHVSVDYNTYILKLHSDRIKLFIDNNIIYNLLNIKFTQYNYEIIRNFIKFLFCIYRKCYTIIIKYKPYIFNIYDNKVMDFEYYEIKNILLYLTYTDYSDKTILHFISRIESIEINVIQQSIDAQHTIILQIPPVIISIDMI